MSIWSLSADARKCEQALYERNGKASIIANPQGTAALIRKLAAMEEPAAIPVIAGCLFSTNKEIHDASAQGVSTLLNLVPASELSRLSEGLGRFYFGYVFGRWSKLKPREVKAYLSRTQDIAVGNLLSLHKNGFIRQAAIRFLASVDTGQELRFLLIRQNDWVDSVCKQAKKFVLAKLKPDYLEHFGRETNLMFQLLECERRDLSEVVFRYIDLLIQPENQSHLQQAIGQRQTGKVAHL